MASVHLDHALADQLIAEAVHAYAEENFLGDGHRVVEEIHQGNCEVCGAVATCLAHRAAAYLAQMDHSVKAVYRYEPDPGTARVALPSAGRSGINLVIWGGRKSAAFNSLSTTLSHVLSERRRRVLCREASVACQVLDIQMVEEKDVLENRGQGLLVNHPRVRSEQVWKLAGGSSRPGEHPAESLTPKPIEDPGSASLDALLKAALVIEKQAPTPAAQLDPQLQDFKVELIRRLLSEQPRYIEIAKDWLKVSDLVEVSRARVGGGPVGGESAGLVLAARILAAALPEGIRALVKIPESYYLGADLIYSFMAANQLMHWNYQKYKPEEQIRSEYPLIRAAFRAGDFSEETKAELRLILRKIGRNPLIVRSSSILEDSFGSAFAGKYEFLLCPNQGTPEENLAELVRAIASVYASTLCPEALLYRNIRGLRDYDERMGVLIQPVQGERFERYLLPAAAGVALSRNLYRWSPQIRAEDGFVRLVWGLGTSAVERASNNPPRLVGLSSPGLQPNDPAHPEWSFCQKFVDVVDLQDNRFTTLPVHQVIKPDYPAIRWIAQHKEADYFTPVRGRVLQADIPNLAITLEELLRKTGFAATLNQVLRTLEQHYQAPVDIGFTALIKDPEEFQPEVQISILHCRRQGYLAGEKPEPVPAALPPERLIFQTHFMVPRGQIRGIQRVVWISPEGYARLPDQAARDELRLAIYRLNAMLKEKTFLCAGPGQWGAANPRLGVSVDTTDIHKAAALVEIYGRHSPAQPDPALGTYAFQDLMEAHIYPLVVSLDQPGSALNPDFFNGSHNTIERYFTPAAVLKDCLHLIEVADFAPGCELQISMDDEKGVAIAYLAEKPVGEASQ